ncbi:MAG: sodium-dependent transporter, partial [Methanobrevibacter sp.]|nr:sodium-dependent transporter [Methanobrevibacter sp.]
YASYLPEGFALSDNALLVAFTNSGFEVFNAFGVFSILGFMTFTTGIPFNDLVTEGTGLAFVVFPQVFNQMGDAAYIIAPLFFFSILFAGLTSAIALVEPIASSLTEKFNIGRRRAATLVCLIGLIISLVFTTRAGSLVLGVFDLFLNNYALLFTIVLECIIFGWIYKFDNLIETLNQYSRFKVGRLWKFVIRFALPIVIFLLWIQGILSTLFEGDSVTYSIMLVLFLALIIIPVILSKLPARNEEYYEALEDN